MGSMENNTEPLFNHTNLQLAVFDIDGTIAHLRGSSVSQEILDGFAHLHSLGIITTVCTGRPYARMREALGENYDRIVSEQALIPIEHGAKIVDRDGNLVVQSEFSKKDIDKLLEFTGLNIAMVKCLIYNPANTQIRSQIWVPEPTELEAIREKRGSYADVYTGTLIDVRDRLYLTPVGNVTLKLRDHIKVENLVLEFTGGSIKAIFQDGSLEYMKSRVNKARAISYICKYYGVYERNLLVAGNAINDVDMLNMETRYRILVGPDGAERNMVLGYLDNHDGIKFVDSPEDLGRFLQNI